MASPSNFQIAPCVENHEINFCLYYQITPCVHTRLGPTAVIDWPVDDGSKVVARAQGLRIYAGNGNGHNTFSLVFEDGRFKGSTLQVMGISAEQCEWAIVGGTGQFARATGFISKKLHGKTTDGKSTIIELAIHAFCPLPNGSLSLVTKIGPFGGSRGTDHDIKEAPRRLESITVCHKKKEVIYSIKFSYIDHTGKKRTVGPWGGSGDVSDKDTVTDKIKLDSSEFVKEVSGTFGKYKDYTVITSLKFVTNDNKTRGHYGDCSAKETRFSVPVQDSSVVGFFGRGKDYLHAVGVYVHPF